MSPVTACVEPATDQSRGLTRRQLETVEKIREAGRTEALFILSLVDGLEPTPGRRRTIIGDASPVPPDPVVAGVVIGEPIAQAERPEFVATPVQEPAAVVRPVPVGVEFTPAPPTVTTSSTPAVVPHEVPLAVFSTTFSSAPQVAWAGGPVPMSRSGADVAIDWWIPAGANTPGAIAVDRVTLSSQWLQWFRDSTFLHDTLVGQVVVPMFVLIVVLGLLLAFLG